MKHRVKQICKNCKYHEPFSWVCFNPDSINRADFTLDKDSCRYWEEDKKDKDETLQKL